jgi:hypothetical protein
MSVIAGMFCTLPPHRSDQLDAVQTNSDELRARLRRPVGGARDVAGHFHAD